MWSRWLVSLQMFLLYKCVQSMPGSSNNYKINPKPCTVNSYEGTCMFVWECIKSEGQHIGMCVDSFMFGSCCAHNLTENIVVPSHQVFDFKPPPKRRPSPAQSSAAAAAAAAASSPNINASHLNRPHSSHTTIHRPHGGGTLVIRPSHTKRPGSQQHTTYLAHKPVVVQHEYTATTVKLPSLSENTVPDLDTASSISTGLWNPNTHTTQWHVTTQPNFVTKPRPTQWDKLPSRPKPKPTKKPIISTRPTPPPSPSQPSIIHTTASDLGKRPTTSSSIATSTTTTTTKTSTTSHTSSTKPKPQIIHTKPTKPASTPTTTKYTSTVASSPSTASTAAKTKPTKHQQQQHTPTTASTTKVSTSSSTTTTTTTTTTAKWPSSTTYNHMPTTNNIDSIATTDNDLSAPTDTNDILETPSESKRYTLSAAKSADCGVPTMARPETRIVGGKNAPFGRWPWQVSVRRTSFFGFSSTHRCGGAVINEHWIATAGHCVDDLLTSQIRIRVGEYDFSHVQEELPYVERAVAKKVVHPKYNFFTYEYDLALVKLEAPLEFAPHIAPICLPATDDLLIGHNATVTGWGRLSEGGTLPSVLQEVSVPIVSNDRCKTMFLRAGRHEFIPDIFLCAGHETGGHDSCQGDSGGPLQVKSKDGHYFLAGIISWGIGCAEANLPGVCTRISKFTPWILENVN